MLPNKEQKAGQDKTMKGFFASFKSKGSKIHLKTWYFSVVFFVAIFFVCIWVWWVSFYDPQPSQEVVSSFESSKENFQAMKANAEKAVAILKERRESFSATLDFSSHRDIFVDEELLLNEAFQADEDLQGLDEVFSPNELETQSVQ